MVAAVASAVAFGFYYVLLYGDDMTIIFQIFAAGIALAYVYEVSGSIWSAIVLHYLINWMTTVNGYLSKTYREVFACLFYPIVIVVVGVSVVKFLRKSGKL